MPMSFSKYDRNVLHGFGLHCNFGDHCSPANILSPSPVQVFGQIACGVFSNQCQVLPACLVEPLPHPDKGWDRGEGYFLRLVVHFHVEYIANSESVGSVVAA